MYSAENYFWGWVAYSMGAACLLVCLWFLIRGRLSGMIKQSILLVFAVVMMTPVAVESNKPDAHLAPALAVGFFDVLTQPDEENGFQRSFAPVLALTVLTLFMFITVRMVIAKMGKRPPVNDRPVNSSDKRRRSNV